VATHSVVDEEKLKQVLDTMRTQETREVTLTLPDLDLWERQEKQLARARTYSILPNFTS
jgi:hypothetical protein